MRPASLHSPSPSPTPPPFALWVILDGAFWWWAPASLSLCFLSRLLRDPACCWSVCWLPVLPVLFPSAMVTARALSLSLSLSLCALIPSLQISRRRRARRARVPLLGAPLGELVIHVRQVLARRIQELPEGLPEGISELFFQSCEKKDFLNKKSCRLKREHDV